MQYPPGGYCMDCLMEDSSVRFIRLLKILNLLKIKVVINNDNQFKNTVQTVITFYHLIIGQVNHTPLIINITKVH